MWGRYYLIEFIDHIAGAGKQGRYKLTKEDGTSENVTLELNDGAEVEGTPINRENLMALQGMENNNVDIVENEDGSITVTEVNNDNHILTVNAIENEDGSITIVETFVGGKTIVKTTTINANGTRISGVVQ